MGKSLLPILILYYCKCYDQTIYEKVKSKIETETNEKHIFYVF